MNFNSTCDIFPNQAKDKMSPLQNYMINWCINKLEELRLVEMQAIKKSTVQYIALGIICLWIFCSIVQLSFAVWRWCVATRDTKQKLTVMLMYLISLTLVSKGAWSNDSFDI